MIVFPVQIPIQNFLFPGTGREKLKCHGKGREIWGMYSRESRESREFPLTPAPSYRDLKDPTIRQNFDDTVEQKRVIDLRACHMYFLNARPS